MKKSIVTKALAITLTALTFATTSISAMAATLTLEQAKQVALDNEGLSASDVSFSKEKKDIENGKTEYELTFSKGLTEYEYEIDAATGKILSVERETKVDPQAALKAVTSQLFKSEPTIKVNKLTSDEALDIALTHAGYDKEDTLFTMVKSDFEDGMEVYEVKFRVGFVEYSYDIEAATGNIIDFEIDD